MVAKRTKMPPTPHDSVFVDDARGLTSWMCEFGGRVSEQASEKVLEPEEREKLKNAVQGLRYSFEILESKAKILESKAGISGLNDFMCLHLTQLMDSAFRIGEFATASEPSQRFTVVKRAKEYGGKNRPGAQSMLTGFILQKLRRNPKATNSEIKTAIIGEAENGTDAASFRLEGDRKSGSIVWEDERDKPKSDGTRDEHRKEIRDLGSAISKARKKLQKKNCR